MAKRLQKAIGTRLDFSTTFHPQTDGQTERLNQILEDMLRACVMDLIGSWDTKLHLMEFSYNNSFQATIGMAPFEVLYGKQCRSPLCWDEVGERELVGPELVRITNEARQKIRIRMRNAQSRQKSYADVRHRNLEFEEGDPVFLKVAPMKGILRFRRKGEAKPPIYWTIRNFRKSRFGSLQTSFTTFAFKRTRCISCVHFKKIYYKPYARNRLQTSRNLGKFKLSGETD